MKLWEKIADWSEKRQIKRDWKRRQDRLNRRLEMALYAGEIEGIEQAMMAGARPSILLQHYTDVHYGRQSRRPSKAYREWLCRMQRVELPKRLCTHEDNGSICSPQHEKN